MRKWLYVVFPLVGCGADIAQEPEPLILIDDTREIEIPAKDLSESATVYRSRLPEAAHVAPAATAVRADAQPTPAPEVEPDAGVEIERCDPDDNASSSCDDGNVCTADSCAEGVCEHKPLSIGICREGYSRLEALRSRCNRDGRNSKVLQFLYTPRLPDATIVEGSCRTEQDFDPLRVREVQCCPTPCGNRAESLQCDPIFQAPFPPSET